MLIFSVMPHPSTAALAWYFVTYAWQIVLRLSR